MHLRSVAPDDIVHAAGIGETNKGRRLVCVQGTVEEVSYSYGFNWGVLRLETMLHPIEGSRVVQGVLRVRFPHGLNPLSGERYSCMGWLLPPESSDSDRQRDWVEYARHTGSRGLLLIPEAGNIHRLPHDSNLGLIILTQGIAQDASLRRLVHGVADTRVRALLTGLVLGVHLDSWKQTAAPFRRIGVAHLLAISGMHVGIIVLLAHVSVRLLLCSPLVQGVTSLLFLVAYACLVQWRAPVQRAAIMLGIYFLLWIFRRRCKATGLLMFTGILVLILDPGQMFQVGFQLSYLVVFAIIMWGRRVQRRWISTRDHARPSWLRSCTNHLSSTFIISLLAWCVATPIVLHHFGIMSPLGPLLSVVLLLPTVLLVVLGFTRILVSQFIPALDGVVRQLIEVVAKGMLNIADYIDALPWSSFEVARPPFWLACMLLVFIATWAHFGLRHMFWSFQQWCRRVHPSQGRRPR